MLFNSWTFLIFFVTAFFLHKAAPTWGVKKVVLLLASYLFYAAWNPPYVLILLFSTVLDWWLAQRIALCEGERARRGMLLISLICNLGLLGVFKYGNFLLENFRSVVAAIGVTYQPPMFDIVLPIGISFYTFASLSYTIDVYRREIRADSSLLDYALFVSFFPHLVAGPIVRASQLLPQFKQPREASSDQIGWGLVLVVVGLFSKVVLADYVFAPIVDKVYANPEHTGALDAWTAIMSFSGQIYYDFSGYSSCAIGLALCFGFEFPDNFRYPYAARGFSDFWRRWHITLSTWLRDYLYVPLGGNRTGEWRTYLNLMLTMLIGGLWHGASWMFIFWGGIHGLFLSVERFVRWLQPDSRNFIPATQLALTLFTFLMVTLAWIPFRAPTMHAVSELFQGLGRTGSHSQLEPAAALTCFAVIAATVGWHLFLRDSSFEERFGKLGNSVQMMILSGCLFAMFLVSGGDARAFIYFQF